ncbi:MAG TPA: dioxygenase [Steroidobacteraceae bacterium]
MIISGEQQVTDAVLSEIEKAPSVRYRQIMSAAVRHLHEFVREVKLNDVEFQQACAYIAALGQATNASHNEVVLCFGSLGVSSLICLLNNGNGGKTETTASMMGPFWRLNSPPVDNGGSIVRSPTAGTPLFVDAWVLDLAGKPIADAEVDVWHTSDEGFYENQDPGQAEMNLRGKFTTDSQGHIWFRTVKPRGYPIPVNGPVGELVRAQGRSNMRPAHIHFMVYKAGYKTQFSQVFSSDDPNLETDVQFGVTKALIGQYVLHDGAKEAAPALDVEGAWYSLDHEFVIEPGVAALPRPPVMGKATGGRPTLVILERSESGVRTA